MEYLILVILIIAIIVFAVYFCKKMNDFKDHSLQEYEKLANSQAKLLKTVERFSELSKVLNLDQHIPTKEEYAKALENGESEQCA